jgi:hypothetical protein
MLCVCPSQFPLLHEVTNIYEIWNEHYVTGDIPSAVIYNFLHSLVAAAAEIIANEGYVNSLIRQQTI